MPTDYRSLGRYAEAIEHLRHDLSHRHYLATTMSRLLSSIGGPELESDLVRSLDVTKVQEMAAELASLEQQIHTTVRLANANAIQSGKPYLRKT